MKKILSLVLVFALTIGVFAMGAIGVFADDVVELTGDDVWSYAFEGLGNINNDLALILYFWPDKSATQSAAGKIDAALNVNGNFEAEGKAIVTLEGYGEKQTLTVKRFVNGNPYYRLDLQDDGGYIVGGVEYTINVEFYDSSDNLVVKLKDLKTRSNADMYAGNVPELDLNNDVQTRIGDQNNECGFIDGNLGFNRALRINSLSDAKIVVNGQPAYWNIGYKGAQNCGFGTGWASSATNGWIQVGTTGAAIVNGENTITVTMGDSGETYTQTFNAGFTARGVNYSKVDADKTAGTVTAVIIYNEAPGYTVGTQLTGKCHDDHGNTTTFTVTAVDGNKVTMVAENYVPGASLLELKDADGIYTTVTINTAKSVINLPQALTDANTDAIKKDATKQNLTGISSNVGSVEKMFDGTDTTKVEGGWPEGGPVITFKASEAIAPKYLMLYTNDDGRWINRAPGEFILYGSNEENGSYTEIRHILNSGIQNISNKGFSFALDGDTAYEYYKLVVVSRIDLPAQEGQSYNNYFQIAELELYTGEVALPDAVPEETHVDILGDKDSYNGYSTTGAIQFRPNKDGNENQYDTRVFILADIDMIARYDVAKMYVTYTTSDEPRTKETTMQVAYKTIIANGEKVKAPEGYAYFGLEVTDIDFAAAISVSARIVLETKDGEKLEISVGSSNLPKDTAELNELMK